MSTRHAGYIVVLAGDIREDDAADIVTALRMITGVASVQPVETDFGQAVARGRRDDLWASALARLVREGPEGKP